MTQGDVQWWPGSSGTHSHQGVYRTSSGTHKLASLSVAMAFISNVYRHQVRPKSERIRQTRRWKEGSRNSLAEVMRCKEQQISYRMESNSATITSWRIRGRNKEANIGRKEGGKRKSGKGRGVEIIKEGEARRPIIIPSGLLCTLDHADRSLEQVPRAFASFSCPVYVERYGTALGIRLIVLIILEIVWLHPFKSLAEVGGLGLGVPCSVRHLGTTEDPSPEG
jgi:hypothetical protein